MLLAAEHDSSDVGQGLGAQEKLYLKLDQKRGHRKIRGIQLSARQRRNEKASITFDLLRFEQSIKMLILRQ